MWSPPRARAREAPDQTAQLNISDKSTFGKRNEPSRGEDQVIDDAHVDQCQRVSQRAGQQLVRATWLGGTRWMVVREKARRRAMPQRGAHDFARVHRRL